MPNKDVKKNNIRKSFSKNIKRKILTDIANQKNPKDVFLEYGIIDENISDKKYISKLLHKWRQEMYQNKEQLYFANYSIDDDLLDEEIKNIKVNNEKDELDRESFLKYENDLLYSILLNITEFRG